MKFIDFNDQAIECISLKQWQDLAKFKTREDAIKAARLCKNAQTVVEAGEIIAKAFPKFATDIFDYLKHFENTNNSTI